MWIFKIENTKGKQILIEPTYILDLYQTFRTGLKERTLWWSFGCVSLMICSWHRLSIKLFRINMESKKKPRIELWGYSRIGVIWEGGNLDRMVSRSHKWELQEQTLLSKESSDFSLQSLLLGDVKCQWQLTLSIKAFSGLMLSIASLVFH